MSVEAGVRGYAKVNEDINREFLSKNKVSVTERENTRN